MKKSDFPSFLPGETEERLDSLLARWAGDYRLPVESARNIREEVQEHDAWEQAFWARVSPVLLHTTTVTQPVPAQSWDTTITANLAWISPPGGFDAPGSYAYLRLGN